MSSETLAAYFLTSAVVWFSFLPVIIKFKLWSWLPGRMFGYAGDIINILLSFSDELEPDQKDKLVESFHATRILFAISILPGLIKYRCKIIATLYVVSIVGTFMRVCGSYILHKDGVATVGLMLIQIVIAF